MRRVRLLAALIIVILGLVGVWLLVQSPLSPDQRNSIKLFGYPADFVITYLPRKDGQQLVRSEVWYYPEIGKQFSFLGGKLAGSDKYANENKLPPTDLKPEDFDFDTQYTEIEEILGKENIDPVDYLEAFADENLQTYFSPKAVFIIENGQLTYFQTVGLSDQPQPTLEPPTPTPLPTPTESIATPSATPVP
jgi:hypothetical protein